MRRRESKRYEVDKRRVQEGAQFKNFPKQMTIIRREKFPFKDFLTLVRNMYINPGYSNFFNDKLFLCFILLNLPNCGYSFVTMLHYQVNVTFLNNNFILKNGTKTFQ